jgi:hypothetical protein
MTEGPLTNVDEFRHRPVNELAALLPDKQAADAAVKDLQTAKCRHLGRTRFARRGRCRHS